MASVEKWGMGGTEVLEKLRHSSREIKHPSNPDIDPARTNLNYSLSPDHGGRTDYEYYQERLSEVYVYDRGPRADETVACAGWIVTLPEGNFTPEEEKQFFEAVTAFLSDRFGGQSGRNVISAAVHYDEGKQTFRKDDSGENVLDNEGHRIPSEFRIGKPHLHFNFVPCVKIDHERENAKRWHDPKIDAYEEKLCASEVLDKRTLREIHPQMQQYLDNHGLSQFRVVNGKTATRGYTVEQLKERTDLENRIIALEATLSHEREIIKQLALENASIQEEMAALMRTNVELQHALEMQREAEQNSRWTAERDRGDRSSRWN